MTIFSNLDLLKWGQEITVCAIVVVALALIYRYRRRVVFLLTGDDKIHASVPDSLYFTFCKACGTCNGEWTRCLTSCPCCPTFLYQRNLVKEFARFLGFTTKTIEIKNIVVGDLPFDKARGDFYVCISVGTNPDMVTALQEEKMPKCVHFPEILQLKIRDNMVLENLEPRIYITVKELNIAGSETLCGVRLSPSSVVDWCNDDVPLKRFQMKPVNGDIERETPPWIAMEFSNVASENRHLETLMNHPSKPLVRTYLPVDGHEHIAAAQGLYTHPDDSKKGSVMTSDGTLLGTRKIWETDTKEFKEAFRLVDDTGNPIEEPPEDHLNQLWWRRCCINIVFTLFDLGIFASIVGFLLHRFYAWSCYRQFRWLAMTAMNRRDMTWTDMSEHVIEGVVEACHNQVRGTGVAKGVPCRPAEWQVSQVDDAIPDALRPEAFQRLVKDAFGFKLSDVTLFGAVPDGIRAPCYHGVCAHHTWYDDRKWWMVLLVIVLVILTRLAKCWANQCIKGFKRRAQADAVRKSQLERNRGGQGQRNLYSGSAFGSPRGAFAGAPMLPQSGFAAPPGGYV